MGLELLAKDGPIPRELMLKLICDGRHDRPRAWTFEADGDIDEMMAAATVFGWKQTYVNAVKATPNGPKAGLARIFLCPECGRK